MATYVYHCDKCGDYEVRQPMSAPDPISCPWCNSPVKRVIQPVPHTWKGAGKSVDTAKFDKAYEERVKRE